MQGKHKIKSIGEAKTKYCTAYLELWVENLSKGNNVFPCHKKVIRAGRATINFSTRCRIRGHSPMGSLLLPTVDQLE